MFHSCFIHLSTDGHMDCFHILVIVNNTAVNIRVLMFFQISVLGSFRYIPRSGIAGSKGKSIFNFLNELHTAFYSGYTNLWSHQQRKGSPFSTSSPAVVCWFIDDGHSDKCEMVSHCGFNLHFSDQWHWTSFHMSNEHLYVLFGEVSIQSLCPFFIWVVILLLMFISTL